MPKSHYYSQTQSIGKKGLAKERLLDNLRKGTFCRLAPSKLSGVGVFSIRGIPKGVDPFPTVYPEKTDSVDITQEELESLPQGVGSLMRDFFMRSESGNYPVLSQGMNGMTLSYYLNHSDNPNLEMVDTGQNYYTFMTKRPVRKGEELTIDYLQHCQTPEDRDYYGAQFGLLT